jgi:HEAT repeat protein
MVGTDETINRDDSVHHANIQSLIANLGNKNGCVRIRARETLVNIRSQAVTSLVSALQDRDWRVRWEAAKALGEIGDARAAPALVGALEDARSGIRWLAAGGLIAIGREALPPIVADAHSSLGLGVAARGSAPRVQGVAARERAPCTPL